MPKTDFTPMFHPRGIAVIGASTDLNRPGAQALLALSTQGYKGGVYPVNPKYEEVSGYRCYPSVAEIKEPCDMAVIALPAALVPDTLTQCGKHGIRFAVVVGGGFREMGPEGIELERKLKAAARAGPTTPSAMPLAVSRWSALSARSSRRNSARLVNIR